MAVFLVIPGEEVLTERPGILDGPEAIRKSRTILQGFELGFGVRVVIAHMGPAVRLGHTQVRHELGNNFRFHAGTPVRMEGQLPRGNPLFDATLFDEAFGQGFVFPVGDHPSDNVTAENIKNHVEIEIRPLGRPFQFGDVPGPDLIGGRGQEFRFLVWGLLVALSSLFDIAVLSFENPVHGPDGTVVLPFIEQDGIDLSGGIILEARAMEQIDHGSPFSGAQGQWRRQPRSELRRGAQSAVKARTRHAQGFACRCGSYLGAQGHGRPHELLPSLSRSGWGIPRMSEIFF